MIAACRDDEIRGLEFGVEVEEDAGDHGAVGVGLAVGGGRMAGDHLGDATGKDHVFGDLTGRPTTITGLGIELLVGKRGECVEEVCAGAFGLFAERLFAKVHCNCVYDVRWVKLVL